MSKGRGQGLGSVAKDVGTWLRPGGRGKGRGSAAKALGRGKVRG